MKSNIARLLLSLSLLLTFSAALHAAAAAPPAHPAEVHGAVEGEGAEPEARLLRPINEGLISAVTTLVVFLVLVVVLGKFAWGPIAGGLKAREEKIRKDILDAEEARAKAEATLRDYNTQLATAENRVRDMLSKATADGEKLATGIRMKAQQEAEEIKERSQRDIEAARDQALREIYEKTAELSTSIAEKIIRRNLNPADQQDLVRQSLDQLQTVR
jgi:F-type H+-transporting ATPase subunit b